ncbi:SRPBCC family protein [Micromonospora sp. NPDC051925]|uniref:SRPBCC family protein n=1 Tax=Micromonospora sp. NPDC051925 TaxID=3364288 RepID=UPI0037C71833
MAIVEKVIDAPPQRVFDVLADGWTYSDWVVSTVHVRDVDAQWPRVGTRLHHRAGPCQRNRETLRRLSDIATRQKADQHAER